MFGTHYASVNSAQSLQSAGTLPGDDAGGYFPREGTAYSLDSQATVQAGDAPQFGKPRSSGLFGRPRLPSRSPANDPYATMAQDPYAQAYLHHDPFMTSPVDYPLAGVHFQSNEQTPLQPGGDDEKSEDSGKRTVMLSSCAMILLTVGSGVALGVSFGETGHRDGYEEGHLDGNRESGCQSLFYWLLFQFCLDLVIICMTCLILMPAAVSDTVGFFGCCASFRLCAMAAGFHILYSAGLQRELCNQFLVTWSTIITWLGIGFMVVVCAYMLLLLLGAHGSARKVGQPHVGQKVPF